MRSHPFCSRRRQSAVISLKNAPTDAGGYGSRWSLQLTYLFLPTSSFSFRNCFYRSLVKAFSLSLINQTSETWQLRPLPPSPGSPRQVSVNEPRSVAVRGIENSSGLNGIGLAMNG